jgi:hypothetical protein
MTDYFTDREFAWTDRTNECIDERLWAAIVSLIEIRLEDHSFGYGFPAGCPDGEGPCGCNDRAFAQMLEGEIPWIEWPLKARVLPQTPVILDLLEFCAAAVGEPIEGAWHSFYRHSHLKWDHEAGRARFVGDANRLLRRNGVAFELDDSGKARRILPEPVREVLSAAQFSTGDALCDQMIDAARKRLVLPNPAERRESLEKLWDAYERMKTLEPGDKRAAADALLDKAAPPGTRLREIIAQEAKALTDIGNSGGIRHSETSQEHVTDASAIDYLFTRMFSFLYFLAKRSGRAT